MKRLIIFSGSAGSGKGTVLSELFKLSDNFRYSVSVTTRKPRKGEIDGVNYVFVTHEEFKERIARGDFAEYVEYCGNFYGTSQSYIHSLQEDGFDVVLEIETIGALNVMKTIPDNLSIFLAPPTYDILEYRLRKRGTETEEDIQKRLNEAKFEIERATNYDFIVLNRDNEFERAARVILEICKGNPPNCDIVIDNKQEKEKFTKSFMKI